MKNTSFFEYISIKKEAMERCFSKRTTDGAPLLLFFKYLKTAFPNNKGIQNNA